MRFVYCEDISTTALWIADVLLDGQERDLVGAGCMGELFRWQFCEEGSSVAFVEYHPRS